ncbi:flagellar motor protein MotB [Sphingomonas cannabina]|uniref:flagellar motor protein MotB n=1 Tax=Sphingomonas cannabina TaxID=2899123 RepID=UPI001F17CC73|nr:flagellar motor protein MotB [Sphingomonas cannabina]UIJ45451.1 flagellar motor protein MotB [Sphingomonas cannabina]
MSDLTIDDPFEEGARRPLWLITLADLMLLLVGFFVFLQANRALDGRAIAEGLRQGFDAERVAPMPVDASVIAGFAPGSAALPSNDAIAWAREAARDPRTTLRVIGGTDGTPGDVDRATGSAAILAADRARAAAALLARAVPADRIAIETRPGAGRAVQLQIGFAGDPQ